MRENKWVWKIVYISPLKLKNTRFFELASHEITREKCLWRIKLFAGRPYPRNTRDNQLLPSIMTLRIPIMCWAHASLREKSSRELLAKTPLIFDESWIFTLSHTQPIQRNLTYNTGYIRMNRIIIKFGTKLKPIQISCKSQLYNN